MRLTVIYVAAWACLAIASAVLMGMINLPLYWTLAKRGVPVTGSVMEITAKIHNTVRYQYVVAGQTYNGQARPFPPNAATQQQKEGAELSVYYDPQSPNRSVLGAPGLMLHNEIIFVISEAIFMSSSVLFFFFFILLPNYRRNWSYI
jgi:hypothetical protein